MTAHVLLLRFNVCMLPFVSLCVYVFLLLRVCFCVRVRASMFLRVFARVTMRLQEAHD